jgi:ribosomal protein S4E
MKEIKLRKMAYEIWEIKECQIQWKKTIKARFEDDNGLPWTRVLRNRFNYSMIFREIKRCHNLDDVYEIVKKALI